MIGKEHQRYVADLIQLAQTICGLKPDEEALREAEQRLELKRKELKDLEIEIAARGESLRQVYADVRDHYIESFPEGTKGRELVDRLAGVQPQQSRVTLPRQLTDLDDLSMTEKPIYLTECPKAGVLSDNGIRSLEHLATKTEDEVLGYKGIGKQSVPKIKEYLAANGLGLKVE